jgi:hypothetical protein
MRSRFNGLKVVLLLIVPVCAAQAAEKAKVTVRNGSDKIEAAIDGDRSEANINGVKMAAEGGDATLNAGTINLKVESNPDGSPKRMQCTAARNNFRLTGQGSNLMLSGPCKRVEVATTGAMIEIDSVQTVVISGTGNQVTASKLDVGNITGSSNLLRWRQPLSVKQPKLTAAGITSGIQRIGSN